MQPLTKGDFTTETWHRMRRHLQTKLEELRLRNDHPQPDEDTARLRGQILMVKELLALDSPAPVVEDSSRPNY
jgi:hypothetical protein